MLQEYAIRGIVPLADTAYLGLDRGVGTGISNRKLLAFRAVWICRLRVEWCVG
jgi:hypothetical protein